MTDVQVQELDSLVGEWLTLPEVGERLGIVVTKVRQLLRDRQLIGVRRGPNAALYVPAAFVPGTEIVKGLPGLLTVLADAGYSDADALRWLFTADPSLPGTPVQALRENRGTEVKRRAQALAF